MYNLCANFFLKAFNKRLLEGHTYEGAPSVKDRNPSLPYFVNGWQAICMEGELNDGNIISKNVMGIDIITWLSTDGPAVTEAHCPHLGVHLGSGGEIVNGCMRCPLHHRLFKGDGACTNPKLKSLKSYQVVVRLGIVFAWFHERDRKPSWKIPDLETDEDGRRWSTSHDVFRGIVVPAHPIEFIENGVDYHHAVKLHGFCHEGSSMTPNDEKLSVEFRHQDKEKGTININAYGPFIVDYNVNYVIRGKKVYSRFLMLLQFNNNGTFRAHRIKLFRLDHDESFIDRQIRRLIFVVNEMKLFKAFMKEDQLIMINRKYIPNPDYDRHDHYSTGFRQWYSQFVTQPAEHLSHLEIPTSSGQHQGSSKAA